MARRISTSAISITYCLVATRSGQTPPASKYVLGFPGFHWGSGAGVGAGVGTDGKFPFCENEELNKLTPARCQAYNDFMGRHVIRISAAEAPATSVSTLLPRVSAGVEIVIENDARPVAILHATEPVRRTISECIALLPEDSTATIDPDFSKDVASAIESHRAPLDPPAWD